MKRAGWWVLVVATSPVYALAVLMISPFWAARVWRGFAGWWKGLACTQGRQWCEWLAIAHAGGLEAYRNKIANHGRDVVSRSERRNRRRSENERRGL